VNRKQQKFVYGFNLCTYLFFYVVLSCYFEPTFFFELFDQQHFFCGFEVKSDFKIFWGIVESEDCKKKPETKNKLL